jgi:hypothetical protein
VSSLMLWSGKSQAIAAFNTTLSAAKGFISSGICTIRNDGKDWQIAVMLFKDIASSLR